MDSLKASAAALLDRGYIPTRTLLPSCKVRLSRREKELVPKHVKLLVFDAESGSGGYMWVETGQGFEYPVEVGLGYLLAVEFGEPPCRAWFSHNKTLERFSNAATLEVGTGGIRGLRLEIPEQLCSQKVRGRLLSSAGEPLSGMPIEALGDDVGVSLSRNMRSASTLSDQSGHFSLELPRGAFGRVLVELTENCDAEISSDGTVSPPTSSAVWTLDGFDRSDTTTKRDWFSVLVPDYLCRTQLTGKLVDHHGEDISGALVYTNVGGRNTGVTSDANGRFEIPVPEPGSYLLIVNIKGCNLIYAGDGKVTTGHSATLVEVGEDETHDSVLFVVPEGACG